MHYKHVHSTYVLCRVYTAQGFRLPAEVWECIPLDDGD